MKKNKKTITIFLSNPCSINGRSLKTESSWYRFVSKLGLDGGILNIVAPDLKTSTSAFSVSLKKTLTFKKIEHFYYSSYKEFYFKVVLHPILFLRNYLKIIKSSHYIIFRIPTPGFTLVAFLALLLRKPLVVFISGNIQEQSDLYANSRGFKRLLLTVVIKVRIRVHSIFLRRCKYIFCVSTDVMELYKIKDSRTVELLRTPIISINDIDLNNPRSINEVPPKKFKLIRACWIQESKGLEDLIVAVHKVSRHYDISLDIFGSARDKIYGENIKQLICDLGMDDCIKLRGWVSNEGLQKMYKDFDLHVMSSKAEGMPRVCLESAAKGLPQLLCPVGGIPDFFSHLYDAYIVEDCSSKSLQKGIEWFLNNRMSAKKIAANAILGVKKSSFENVANRVNRIFDV